MTDNKPEEIPRCVNCEVREARPYFCTHCQWEMYSDKGLMKKLRDGKLWSK
jgi:hypothetical protein